MAAEKEDATKADAEEAPAPAANEDTPAPVEGATADPAPPRDDSPIDNPLTDLSSRPSPTVGAKRTAEDTEGPTPDSAKRSKVADDSDDDDKTPHGGDVHEGEATEAEPEAAADAAEKKDDDETPPGGTDAHAPEGAAADAPAPAPANADEPTAEIGADPADAVAAAAAAAAAHAAAMAPPAPVVHAAPAPVEPIVKEIDCPATMVGRVIGKGGETIKGMMAQSGAHIAMNQSLEGDVKKVVITGAAPCVAVAEALVTRLLSHPPGLAVIDPAILGPGQESRIVECPKNMVGRVIGKGGETIKGLQAHSGARVQVDQTVGDPCHVVIAGAPASVAYAAEAVAAIIAGGPTAQYAVPQAGAGYGGGYGGYGAIGGYGGYGGYPQAAAAAYAGYYPGYGAYPYGVMGGYDPAAATAAAQQTAASAAQQAGTQQADATAGDWRAVDDGNGKTYYYNGKTGVSQWEKPPGL